MSEQQTPANIASYQSEIAPGTLVNGRYTVQKILGRGGCGRTYLALDKQRFQTACVLKEFFPSSTKERVVSKLKELFEREARVLNNLEHPQIPRFFAWFEEEKRLFLVQDFVKGQTYADLLRKGKKFSEIEAVEFLKNLLPVLSYIHDRNIIHRDLSPDNIMLPFDKKQPVLIDFGVVNRQDSSVANQSFASGTSVGKMGYSPIEQIHYGRCYPNSDLYALAVTAVVLLTGRSPLQLISDGEQGREWIWQRYVDLSDRTEAVLEKMLQTNHKERFKSAAEAMAALTESLPQHIPTSRQSTQVSPLSQETTATNPEATFIPNSSQETGNPTISVAPAMTANFPQKTVSTNRNPTGGKKISFVARFLILLAVAGIAFVGVQSSRIEAICQLFDNCEVENQPKPRQLEPKPELELLEPEQEPELEPLWE